MKEYITKKETDKIFMTETVNGTREMEEDRFYAGANNAIYQYLQNKQRSNNMKKQFRTHLKLGIKNLKIAAGILKQMFVVWVKGSLYNLHHQNRMYRDKEIQKELKRLAREI